MKVFFYGQVQNVKKKEPKQSKFEKGFCLFGMVYTVIFGPIEWKLLHRVASICDARIRRGDVFDGKHVKDWMDLVMDSTPCPGCRTHSKQHRLLYPVPETPSWYRYTVQFHNHVNQSKQPASSTVNEDAYVQNDIMNDGLKQDAKWLWNVVWMYCALVLQDGSIPKMDRLEIVVRMLEGLFPILPPPFAPGDADSVSNTRRPPFLSESLLAKGNEEAWMDRLMQWQMYWDPTAPKLSDSKYWEHFHRSMIQQYMYQLEEEKRQKQLIQQPQDPTPPQPSEQEKDHTQPLIEIPSNTIARVLDLRYKPPFQQTSDPYQQTTSMSESTEQQGFEQWMTYLVVAAIFLSILMIGFAYVRYRALESQGRDENRSKTTHLKQTSG